MTYAGARDDTATEMAETLHFTLPADRLHAAFNSLGQTIATRSREIPPANDGDEPATVELSVVNQLWAQQGFTFLTEYLETLAAQYGAGLRTVDFIADAEAARQTINDWVAQVTKDRIKDLLPEGSLGDLTRLVLTNAVYLKAPWAVPFEKSMTQDGDFHLAGGGTVTAAFMQQSETLGYAQTTDWTAVQLPYKGGELAMVVLLPAAANASGAVADLSSAVADLDGAALQGLLSALQDENVTLSLPKFTATSALSLGDVLQSLGMDLSFSDDADFSGMTGSRDLTIDSVFHNGFVAVDEDGTEAAAATAVVMRLKAAPAEPKTVVVDRPFIWLLRDIETGTILFLGQVTDPTQE
jgi:serpin B